MVDTEKLNPKQKYFKEIKWIPLKNISVVWVEAQRSLNERHAQSIADNFDPEMFGTLAVTLPDSKGVYHVIDGQHRKAAVERLWGSNEKVPCQVFDADDPARAAELFDHINSARKSPVPIELFKVRVTAGGELQVAVNKIVNNCGLTVGWRQPGSVACVSALEGVYQSYGGQVLTAALRVIDGIWGHDVTAFEGHMVRGFGAFLSEYRNIDLERLREAVGAKYTPTRLMGAAKTGKEIHGGKLSDCIKDLLVTTYNAGLRSTIKKLKPKKEKEDKAA